MIRILPVLFVVIAALIGCGKDEVKQVQTAKPQQEMRTRDAAAFVDANFLSEQAEKRAAVRNEIDSLTANAVIDRKRVSAVINRRNGELMALKKNLRASTSLTVVQRDSLITPLEEESIELATDLIAVAK